MQHKHLVIFVKAPKMGRVKTRLARDIGKFNAWRFYRRTVRALIKRVGRGKWKTTICVSPDDYRGSYFQGPHNIIRQGSGDLGMRMQRVFDTMPRGNVVLIGGDIPAIEKHHILRAFDALKTSDTVFGPATDGGFWLVGMRRSRARISPFEGVRWSSEHALADTVANVDLRSHIAFTDMLSDVDTGEDL